MSDYEARGKYNCGFERNSGEKHDSSAAALLINGEIAAAAHEERFTRKKRDSSFPINAVQYLLQDQPKFTEEADWKTTFKLD